MKSVRGIIREQALNTTTGVFSHLAAGAAAAVGIVNNGGSYPSIHSRGNYTLVSIATAGLSALAVLLAGSVLRYVSATKRASETTDGKDDGEALKRSGKLLLYSLLLLGAGCIIAAANLLPFSWSRSGEAFYVLVVLAAVTVLYALCFSESGFLGPLLLGAAHGLLVVAGELCAVGPVSAEVFIHCKLWVTPVILGFYFYSVAWTAANEKPDAHSMVGETVELLLIIGILLLAVGRWWWGALPIIVLAGFLFWGMVKSMRNPGSDAVERFVRTGFAGLFALDAGIIALSGGPTFIPLALIVSAVYIVDMIGFAAEKYRRTGKNITGVDG